MHSNVLTEENSDMVEREESQFLSSVVTKLATHGSEKKVFEKSNFKNYDK